MVEKGGWGTWLTHTILILGIAFICFPIYFAFVASTVSQQDIVQPPLPVVPGPHFVENYTNALFLQVFVLL